MPKRIQTQPRIIERPIIFGAESVRAILDGRKTQTRRVIKPQPELITQTPLPPHYQWLKDLTSLDVGAAQFFNNVRRCCPYGKAGERLWVRETYCAVRDTEPSICSDVGVTADNYGLVAYKATTSPNGEGLPIADGHFTWKSPMFMPRWASRITLEITNVRVERLQGITGNDAREEGVCVVGEMIPRSGEYRIAQYRRAWDALNAKRKGCSWSDNPWTWVLEFKRAKP